MVSVKVATFPELDFEHDFLGTLPAKQSKAHYNAHIVFSLAQCLTYKYAHKYINTYLFTRTDASQHDVPDDCSPLSYWHW